MINSLKIYRSELFLKLILQLLALQRFVVLCQMALASLLYGIKQIHSIIELAKIGLKPNHFELTVRTRQFDLASRHTERAMPQTSILNWMALYILLENSLIGLLLIKLLSVSVLANRHLMFILFVKQDSLKYSFLVGMKAVQVRSSILVELGLVFTQPLPELYDFAFHGRVPVVLDGVVCPSLQVLCDLSPFVAYSVVVKVKQPLLVLSPTTFLNMRVKVIMPALSALFSNSTRQKLGNESPTVRTIGFYHLNDQSILLLSPRSFFGLERRLMFKPMRCIAKEASIVVTVLLIVEHSVNISLQQQFYKVNPDQIKRLETPQSHCLLFRIVKRCADIIKQGSEGRKIAMCQHQLYISNDIYYMQFGSNTSLRKQTKRLSKKIDQKNLRVAAGQTALEPKDQASIVQSWAKIDVAKTGYISVFEVDDLMGQMGYQLSAQIRKEIDAIAQKKQKRSLGFFDCVDVIIEAKQKIFKQTQENQLESQYTNAWLAFGGASDHSGHIQKRSIVKVLMEEFDMKDIQEWLNEGLVIEEDLITFQTFKSIFQKQSQNSSSGKTQRFNDSVLSFVTTSNIDERRMNEFEQWNQRYFSSIPF